MLLKISIHQSNQIIKRLELLKRNVIPLRKKNYRGFFKNIKQDVNNRKIAYIQIFLRRESIIKLNSLQNNLKFKYNLTENT